MEVFAPGKPVCLILNRHSGWDDSSSCANELKEGFQEAGVPVQVEHVKAGSDITGLARAARERGCSAVIAGGGDGTLNGVAAGLVGSDTCLGIVPIGTLNHLARDLNIPVDPEGALQVLRNPRIARIDVGEVNGRIFLNNSIIGLYPAYEFVKTRQMRRRYKWLAIFSALVSVIRRYPFFDVRLSAQVGNAVRRTPYILVGNNEHRMAGRDVASRARIDTGLLWVYVMRPLTRWGLLKMAFAVLFGRFRREDYFETFAARSLTVRTRRGRIGVALDGDVTRMRTPLQYRALPGALRVIVPQVDDGKNVGPDEAAVTKV